MADPKEQRDSAPETPSAVDRRLALQLLAGGATLGLAGLLGVPLARYLHPQRTPERLAIAAFEPGALGLWQARILVVGGRPAIVVNTGEGYAALSAVCTHLGCIVKWKKGRGQFFCPCHGGRFGLDGRVLGGPAREPLAKLEVQEMPGKVVVRAV